MGNEIASLLQRLAVAGGRAGWSVLDGVHTVAILHIVVCVVQQVKGLRLKQYRLRRSQWLELLGLSRLHNRDEESVYGRDKLRSLLD